MRYMARLVHLLLAADNWGGFLPVLKTIRPPTLVRTKVPPLHDSPNSSIFFQQITPLSSASKWDNQSKIVCFSLLVLFFLTVDVRRRLNQCVVASLTSENLPITLLQVCISHPSIIYVQFSICGQVFVEKESFLKWKSSERLTLLMLRIGTGHDLASLLRSDGRFDGACRYFSLASHHHRHRSSFYAELTVARPFLPSVWYSWRCKNEVRTSRWWVAN